MTRLCRLYLQIGIPAFAGCLLPLTPLDTGSAHAQSSSCRQIVESVRSDIQDRVGGRISLLSYEAGILENSPTSRKDKVSIQLGLKREGPPLTASQEQTNSNILSSKGLIGKYVQAIFSACDDVAQVEMGLAWTDANMIFSLHQDGQVREDECLPSYEHRNLDSRYLRWGVRLCS